MSLYTMIGAMSGTSMDGLDLVLCEIEGGTDEKYSYKILNSKTFNYPSVLLKRLASAKSLAATELFELDKLLGFFYASTINSFIENCKVDKSTINAIASHGHTVFHRPDLGYTLQIGCGSTIAFQTGIPVINDFRQKDVIAGGQGAPLVPIGDQLLFSNEADAYLNIGGFTNISITVENTIAFDICPGNLPLNAGAQDLGHEYDDNGYFAKSGRLHEDILNELNRLNYYQQSPPKSLGTEWLDSVFTPILSKIHDPKDRLHTCIHHIADQIASVRHRYKLEKIFVTGGGAYNGFLLEELQKRGANLVIPSDEVVNYKEALIFAFLGVRFLENKHNCLASVTGASLNVTGGTFHHP